MADKCYNTFTFFGNEAALKQVDDWFSALEKSHKPTVDTPYSPKALFDVFLPNEEVDSLGWFGQKWVYPDFGTEIDLSANELGFVSAWGSPDTLQDLLTKKLSLIDSNIVILNSYNSAEYEEASRYTAIDSHGDVVSQESQLRLIDEDDEESDFNYQLFYEHQCDSLSDLIDAVPSIKKTIAKELKRVEKLFQSTFKT